MNYIKILAQLITIICIFFYNLNIYSQSNKLFVVDTKSGLRMRSGPSVSYKKIDTIPIHSLIAAIKVDSNSYTIANKKGFWIKTFWAGKVGWVFSGFLKKAPHFINIAKNSYWISNNNKNRTGLKITLFIAGGGGTFMGCPGGYKPFDINKALLNKNEIRLEVVYDSLYGGNKKKLDSIYVIIIDDKNIKINNRNFVKSKESECKE